MVERNFRVVSYSAKDAIEKWIDQYGFASRILADGSNSGTISKKLRDLERPTKAQVEAIIGLHGGWTTVFCVCCHEYYPKCVSFGGDTSDEVCEGCLRAALDAVVSSPEES